MNIPNLNIVFRTEDGSHVAHCEELDLIGDGPTKQDALLSLLDAMSSQIRASVDLDNAANLAAFSGGGF